MDSLSPEHEPYKKSRDFFPNENLVSAGSGLARIRERKQDSHARKSIAKPSSPLVEVEEKEIEITVSRPYSRHSFVNPTPSSFRGEEAVVLNSVHGKAYLGKLAGRTNDCLDMGRVADGEISLDGKGVYALQEITKRILFDREIYSHLKRNGVPVYFADLAARSQKERHAILGLITREYVNLHSEGIVLGSFEIENVAIHKNGSYKAEFLDRRHCRKTSENPVSDFLYALSHLHNEGLAGKTELKRLVREYISSPKLFQKAKEYLKSLGKEFADSVEGVASELVERVLRLCKYVEMISHEKEQKRKTGLAYAI